MKSSVAHLFVLLFMSMAMLLSTVKAAENTKPGIIENQDGSVTVDKEILMEWMRLRALQDVKQREIEKQMKEIEKTLKYKCS